MAAYKWQDAEGVVAQNLSKLTGGGGSVNFMVVSIGKIYVQFGGCRGSARIRCETVGNEYLDREDTLPPGKVEKLERLGFVLQDEPANFVKEFEVASDEHARELARLGLVIFESIYGCTRSSIVEIELTLE